MFRHAALCLAANSSLLLVDLCLVSSWRSMSLLLDNIFIYIRTPRQPVLDRIGAAPVTPPGGPEIPTEHRWVKPDREWV